MKSVICTGLLCALLSACATPPPDSPRPSAPAPGADPLLSGPLEWRLVELMGQPVVSAADARVPTLSFTADGQGVSGYSGCNSFSGPVESAAPTRLRFSKLAATLRACPEMALEQQFMQMLAQADSYHVDARQLQLHRARMAVLARFEPVPR